VAALARGHGRLRLALVTRSTEIVASGENAFEKRLGVPKRTVTPSALGAVGRAGLCVFLVGVDRRVVTFVLAGDGAEVCRSKLQFRAVARQAGAAGLGCQLILGKGVVVAEATVTTLETPLRFALLSREPTTIFSHWMAAPVASGIGHTPALRHLLVSAMVKTSLDGVECDLLALCFGAQRPEEE
jgi:hypothetical protein